MSENNSYDGTGSSPQPSAGDSGSPGHVDLLLLVTIVHGCPLLVVASWWMPNTYRTVGVRRRTSTSKFYETRDNLPLQFRDVSVERTQMGHYAVGLLTNWDTERSGTVRCYT